MKLLNIDEEAPEIFYIFIGQGKSGFCRGNFWNYNLTKKITSSGFNGIMNNLGKVQDFIDGNIIYAPFIPNKTTLNSASSHTMAVVSGYNVEYMLEYTRFNNYKNYPSRFSCVYAFGDYESCVKANKLYKWELKNVRKFKLKKTNTVLDSCTKIVKCNMEIVTKMWNCDAALFAKDSIANVTNAYWQGLGQIATEVQDIDTSLVTQEVSEVLYEYLIEGILEELN